MTTDPIGTGLLALSQVTKEFPTKDGSFRAVDAVDLVTEPGEFLTLLGPSGCGKTTTLRMVAGFETPTSGAITLDEADMLRLTPDRRPMSMVFQSYALFPHLTVFENVAYGLKLQRMPAKEVAVEVEAALTSMNLTSYADRPPNQLSGGQQQRVALARAMVMRPKVLLFDEPLSNLDAKLRVQMRSEIRRLQQRMGITAIYVTHDQDEAMSLSDRIVVMNKGRIEQIGSPEDIYRRPASVFVADFIGSANFIDTSVASIDGSKARVQVLGKDLTVGCAEDADGVGEHMLLVRPESMAVIPVGASGTVAGKHGRILTTVFYGSTVEYEIETESGTVVVVVSDPDHDDLLEVGQHVDVTFSEHKAWLLKE